MNLKTYVTRGEVFNPVANVSIAASGTFDSTAIESGAAATVKAWYKTKGANTTAKLQGSFNNTDWYDLQTLAAGVNSQLEVGEPYLRITATNAGAGAESNDIYLFIRV